MLTSVLRSGRLRSAALAAGGLTIILAQLPMTAAAALPAAPCTLPLGCGGPPTGVSPIDNCLDPALCGNGGGQPPAGGGAPVPTPADIAAGLAPGLQLPAVKARTAPGDVLGGKTYAKLLTYLWVQGWGDAVPATDTQGGQTVQVTGHPYYAQWDLVETQQRCDNAGSKTSPECTYTYNRSSPNGGRSTYPITVTVFFKIHWECTAGCTGAGDLPDRAQVSPPYNLAVGEIQGVNSGK